MSSVGAELLEEEVEDAGAGASASAAPGSPAAKIGRTTVRPNATTTAARVCFEILDM
jgi:hypothetical protein